MQLIITQLGSDNPQHLLPKWMAEMPHCVVPQMFLMRISFTRGLESSITAQWQVNVRGCDLPVVAPPEVSPLYDTVYGFIDAGWFGRVSLMYLCKDQYMGLSIKKAHI